MISVMCICLFTSWMGGVPCDRNLICIGAQRPGTTIMYGRQAGVSHPTGMFSHLSHMRGAFFVVLPVISLQFDYNIYKQECIPVGCIPPASVAATRCKFWDHTPPPPPRPPEGT